MGQPHLLQQEIDILYDASRRLVQASTPEEVLEAVSSYPREKGAHSGHLCYIDEQLLGWVELIAEWSLTEKQRLGPGWRMQISDRSIGRRWFANPTQPLLISDIQTSEIVAEDSRTSLDRYGVQAIAVLPLNNKGRWIGVLYFFWEQPYAFTAHDDRILTTLQQQASPVIDAIRLLDQARKRTQELELVNQEINLLYRASEVINRANTYDEVVAGVAQFDPEADVVTLMLWENFDYETARYLEVVTVIDRHNSGKLPAGVRLPKENFPIAVHMLGERVWLFEDSHTDPRIDPVTAANWQALDIRSFMGPAFYVDQRWIGGITFHSARPRTYSQREARLFTGIGDLALAAIERIHLRDETEASRLRAEALARANAELLKQTQHRAAELELANAEIDRLYRVGEAINAANSYPELVNAVAGIISGETAVALYFWENWDEETAAYVEQVAATGYLTDSIGRRTPKEMLTYAARHQQEKLMVLEDVSADPRLDDPTITRYLEMQLYAALSIRLHVKGRWIGALVFHSKVPRSFSIRERRMAIGVGDYVRGAVERIRLQHETEAARQIAEDVARQAQRLASLEERTRLARELHDSVSQVLYGIGLGARTARMLMTQDPSRLHEPLEYILSLAEAGLTEMRALIFELRPESLAEEGLVSTLSKQVTSLKARYGIDVQTEFCEEPSLNLETKEGLYRIAREALHNTIKHAQATEIRVSLKATAGGYALEIVDNGLGFDPDQSFPGHLGLKSMHERTVSLNGTLLIESTLGQGTRILITL
ncbi:MAG: histidine kinase [Anaerolineae bacterium]